MGIAAKLALAGFIVMECFEKGAVIYAGYKAIQYAKGMASPPNPYEKLLPKSSKFKIV